MTTMEADKIYRTSLRLATINEMIFAARELILKSNPQIGTDTERAACKLTVALQAIELITGDLNK